MGDLTLNFSRREFECKCSYSECIKFWMDEDVIHGVQDLRNILGVRLDVNSGCRCIKHNRDIGGSTTSQHLQGLAIDLFSAELNVLEIFEAALVVPIFKDGGIGIYFDDKFVHVDGRERRIRWSEDFGVWRPLYY